MDEKKDEGTVFDWMREYPPDYNWLAHDWQLRWQVRVFAADATINAQPIAQFTSLSEDYQACEDFARISYPGRFLEFLPVSH